MNRTWLTVSLIMAVGCGGSPGDIAPMYPPDGEIRERSRVTLWWEPQGEGKLFDWRSSRATRSAVSRRCTAARSRVSRSS